MAMDPYLILGVERNATDAQIRKAYRSMARIHHPDKNLDDPYAKTRFQQVKNAYEILKDPERRQRFDNGESTQVFDIRGAAINALITMMLDQLKTKGDRNIIENIRTAISDRVRGAKQARRQCKKSATEVERVKERFSYSGKGRNVLADAIDDQQNKLLQQLTAMDREIDTMDYAAKFLDDYADNSDQELPLFTACATSATTA